MNSEPVNTLLLDQSRIETRYSLDDLPIHILFELQAARTPDHIAAIYEQEQLTYRELNEYADKVGALLRGQGAVPGDFIPIVMHKGLNFLISMLAILKSGAAYVPVDPDWPLDRIRYILEDVDGPCSLTEISSDSVAGDKTLVVDYSSMSASPADTASIKVPDYSDDASAKLLLEAAMYVIYTSGSTGKPKGAIVPHRGIVNRFQWMTETLGSDTAHTTLQLSSPTFDSSVWQFLWPLAHGGKTVIPSQRMEKTAENILKLVHDYQITLFHVVPSLFDFLTEQLEYDEAMRAALDTVQYVWVGGEKLSPATVASFQSMFPDIRISNHYGPTETSIACLYYPIEVLPEGDIPLGRPIKNVQIVLLDDAGKQVEPGEPGEIYIGGAGVGLGYLRDTEKTAQAFIANPFPELNSNQLYKTGDIGRLLPDGSIAFMGRRDFQIKIRGFRVELSEIEASLMAQDDIRQAVVLARTDASGDKFLVAYYRSEQIVPAQELRNRLLKLLPDYMIPLHYKHLTSMPLLNNGKINLQELLQMPLEMEDSEAEAPASETEHKLLSIWKTLLGASSSIGRNSDFFQLGGQSLKATRCAMLVNKCWGIKLKIADVFHYPTLRQLASFIDSLKDKGIEENKAIMPVAARSHYPVTSAQKRLYILHRTQGAHTSYNIPGFLVIEGALDSSRLEAALGQLTARHESLRTSFQWNGKEPVQVVQQSVELKLEKISLDGRTPEAAAAAFVRPFDLTAAPLIRVGLAKLDENSNLFMFDVHHIAADAISVSILLQELFMFYQGDKPEELSVSYTDYAVWEQDNEALWKRDEAYWVNQFDGAETAASLPHDFPRPAERQYESSRVKRYLTPEQNARLDEWCRHSGTTKYMVLFSIFSILQMQYTNHEDIVIGTPTSGRQHPDLEPLVGMFVQTLAIRTFPVKQQSFRSYLSEVKQTVLEALDRQDYPFEELIDKLRLVRDPGRNPLFDTMFVLQNMDLREAMLVSQGMHVSQQRMYDWTLRPFAYEHHAAKFDFMLEAVERAGATGLKFDYNTSLFRQETIEWFAESFISLLDRFLAEPDALLGDVSCVTERQRQILLEQFNDTEASFPDKQTLDRLFDEQTARYPHHTAVRSGEETLSYLQLNDRVTHIACLLQNAGVQPGDAVGILTERSVDMLAGILGVLKAGGAYMPIDPAYPDSRIDYMLEDSGTSIVLSQRKTIDRLRQQNGLNVILLDDLPEVEDATVKLKSDHGPADIAYIIYTSGTTGKPKGVMIEHHSIMNRINWMQTEYPIGPEDVVLQKTTFTFDVSVWELFWWVFAGASVTLLAPGAEKEPKQILRIVKEDQVTAMHFVPSMMSLFLDYAERDGASADLSSLRYLFASGEALPRRQVNRFHALPGIKAKLINVYGPTEATVDVTFHLCEPTVETGPVPIGRPIHNTQIYILNDKLEPVPIGVPGDLWIAGVGVARGYLNQTELTADKFVPCPFRPDQRMYHSGDIARWLPNGQIEYFGRSDHQIKIRGFRIEADEIIHHALSFPQVTEAIIQVRGEHEEARICLYIVAASEVSAVSMTDHLAGSLPSYMVPDFVVQLEAIPLSPNGKADLKQLPEPSVSLQAPVNEMQEQPDPLEAELLEIWQQLLNIKQIGLDDDFFKLGGNSLHAIRLELEVEDRGYPVDNIGVFRHRTPRAYARHIRTQLV